ncbi:MAG: hypothetical protein WD533_08675, partial [Dehalococcoidia bacterium]
EVVEASVDRLVGQCHRLYDAPPLGTLVRAGDSTFAVVEGIATTALDPARRVIARGADADTEEDVYREHPQLERLLRTDVTLAVVGHREASEVRQYLPPQPPRIHTFLYTCSSEEVREFMRRLDFLHLLAGNARTASDDVAAAVLRQAAAAFDTPRDFLLAGGRTLATLLASDTARLNAILRRLPLAGGG